MSCKYVVWSAVLYAASVLSTPALAEASADEANKSNNPLNPAAPFNIQNYYTPSVFGASAHTNDLLRPTVPIGPNSLIGVPEIFRATMPVSTRPDPSLGTGKWQAGLAAVAVGATKARHVGALVQWQHSFAGQSSRPTTQSLTAQPFGIFNMPGGWYVRSTGTWSFDLQHGTYYVPVGLGAGKAWKGDTTAYSAFHRAAVLGRSFSRWSAEIHDLRGAEHDVRQIDQNQRESRHDIS